MTTITEHASWDPEGSCLIEHADPACGFIAWAEVLGTATRTVDCRFCIGGADVRSLGRAPSFPFEDGGDTERFNQNRKAPQEQHDGPLLSPEERFARVATWLLELGRKVEIMDVTHANKRVANDWLRAYEGDFEFLLDIKEKGGAKSDGQAKGVLNCLRADLLRGPKQAAETPPETALEIPGTLAEYLP